MHLLTNKTAIITGSSSGIGKGIALLFARLGARVVVTSRTMSQAAQVADEIRAAGGQATPCPFDLGDHGTISGLLAAAREGSGRIDILVNNALSRPSIAPLALQDMEYDRLQEGIAANLTNILALTAAAYPHLKEAGGTVINIGSAVVNRHTLGIPLYTILKGALAQTTKALAAEWAGDGIRVNQINPGFVRTDAITAQLGISSDAAKLMIAHFTKQHPLGRVGEVEDVAVLAAFLASGEASWITGSVIDIDGGFSVQGATFS